MRPLEKTRLVTLAVNLPGPLAVARLRQLGAAVTKIEPPGGDPLARARPDWYRELHEGVDILKLNLKEDAGRDRLFACLDRADLLLTATRPAALARLGLAWPKLHERYPRLSQVAIIGYPAPDVDLPGHDLTYQARHGLLAPPGMPRAVIADSGGAQDTVCTALALILARERGQGCHYAEVSLANAAAFFAEPLRRGMTAPGGGLGGGFPGYGVYQAREGWIAVAALEPHFWLKIASELGVPAPTHEQMQDFFRTRTAQAWEQWALQRDLPISALNLDLVPIPKGGQDP